MKRAGCQRKRAGGESTVLITHSDTSINYFFLFRGMKENVFCVFYAHSTMVNELYSCYLYDLTQVKIKNKII